MIPFVDLKAQYLTIKDEIDQSIKDSIDNVSFVAGPNATKFEEEFAKFIGVNHCIACANGTDSLEILLRALGVGEGDEVIVPAISWLSTSEAVSTCGATPIFVDVDPDYYTIDIDKIEEVITENSKVIIPVHLYGQPVDMPKLMALARKHNLKVLEDCAQAHGAEFNGQKIGTFGDCASFSFYPGKNLGAYGDAGGMLTNDSELARTARMISNHGQEGKHNHLMEGRNSRMDGIQAGILLVKLPHLNSWTTSRIDNAAQYTSSIDNSSIQLPKTIDNGKHVFHLYVIQTDKRDELQSYLKENGVSTAIHYPTALPFLKCYENRGFEPSDFPVAYKMQSRILSIPMFAELSKDQIKTVVDALNKF